MVETNENVMAIIREVALKHSADIPKAVDLAEQKVKTLPEYDELVSELVRHCLREWIYDVRHRANTQMRLDAGKYGQPAKTVSAASGGVLRAAESLFTYRIAGTMLGLIKGEDLGALAASEAARAEGHGFNARLCAQLARVVPQDKTVGEALTEQRLWNIFQKIERRGAACRA